MQLNAVSACQLCSNGRVLMFFLLNIAAPLADIQIQIVPCLYDDVLRRGENTSSLVHHPLVLPREYASLEQSIGSEPPSSVGLACVGRKRRRH
jgi:hypothetical protein